MSATWRKIFARQVSVAICRNAKLRKQAMEGWLAIAATIRAAKDASLLDEFVVNKVIEIFNANAASLVFLRDRGIPLEDLKIRASVGLSDAYHCSWKMKCSTLKGWSKTSRTRSCRSALYFPESGRGDENYFDVVKASEILPALLLWIAGRLEAVINIYRFSTRKFSAKRQSSRPGIAAQAGTAIQSAQASQIEQEAHQSIELILETITNMAHAGNVQEGLAFPAERMVEQLKVSFCIIQTYDKEKETLEIKTAFPVGRTNERPLF